MKLFNTALAAILPSPLPLGSVAQQQRSPEFKQKYQLKEAVVLSRHNIRSPLSDSKSDLGRMTLISGPYGRRQKRTDPPRRRRRDNDGPVFPANGPRMPVCSPKTISRRPTTSMCRPTPCSAALPPPSISLRASCLWVAWRSTTVTCPSKMDPLFNPQLTKVSPEFVAIAMKQIAEQGGKNGIRGISEQLRPDYELIIDVLDVDKSPMTKDNDPKLKASTTTIRNLCSSSSGNRLKSGLPRRPFNGASDAFILQYYEEPDTLKAAFGHKLTRADWERLAHIKDVYQDALFTAPDRCSQRGPSAHPVYV